MSVALSTELIPLLLLNSLNNAQEKKLRFGRKDFIFSL